MFWSKFCNICHFSALIAQQFGTFSKRHDQSSYETISLFCAACSLTATVVFLFRLYRNLARPLNRRAQPLNESISLFCSARSLTATAVFLCRLHRNSARPLNRRAQSLNESISLFYFVILHQLSFFCIVCIQIRHVF